MSTNQSSDTIEDIVLRYSERGMSQLKEYLEAAYCKKAAERLLALERGIVFLATGFYVAGHAETDGPPGTLSIALALKKLGFTPIIITDRICDGLFEPEGLFVLYVGIQADTAWYESILDHFHPVCLISVERCGRNQNQEYANMRGVSISEQTAHIDTMFELASDAHILTIGIGDGGNEIGMGNLKGVISEKLSLTPCEIRVDELIIATTSNWGAYALVAYLDLLQEQPLFPSYEALSGYLCRIVALGCVDGVTKQPIPSVDGFSPEIEQEIVDLLWQIINHTYR
ncbi:MAG: DUF4392 domain-containing protein [Lachnospiraceae bacterium]|nr:DUF4392 domain-containing protein [Lachnospiraceae bacterium]